MLANTPLPPVFVAQWCGVSAKLTRNLYYMVHVPRIKSLIFSFTVFLLYKFNFYMPKTCTLFVLSCPNKSFI